MYYTRVLVGGFSLLVTLYLIWAIRETLGAAVGGAFILKYASYITLALCMTSAINQTCDCLSSEKREDTLGLLFLTHLKGYDIVLGKLIANSLNSICLLLAIVPILGIPVVLGGVAGSELVRIPVALLTALFLGASAGMLISAVVREQRRAFIAAGVTMAFLAASLPALSALAKERWQLPALAFVLNLASPFYAQEMSFADTFGLSTNHFWKAILTEWSLGIGALIAACRIVPHSWKVKERQSARSRLSAGRFAEARPVDKARQTIMLAKNPIFWLGSRDRFARLWPFLFLMASLIGAGCLIAYYNLPREPAFATLFVTIFANDFAMRVRTGVTASIQLGGDRKSGALEMILSTPLTIPEIVKGQWMTIRRSMLETYILLLCIYSVVAVKFLSLLSQNGGGALLACFFVMISIGDVISMGYVGMWKAMRVHNVAHAGSAALARVVLLPWFFWLGLLPLLNKIPAMREWSSRSPLRAQLSVALIVWLFSTATAIYGARRKLLLHFREAATDRYTFQANVSLVSKLRGLARLIFPLTVSGPQPLVIPVAEQPRSPRGH
jgi:hypothetical protein